jgi:hypothetical protein
MQAVECDNWVVVTTINHPTPALHQLVQLPGWRLVVVADKKTPADWHLDGCDFLSVEDQKTLGYSILKYLPWNHYSRKNIGYLWAMAHGAKVIYDTDDDNLLYNEIPFLKARNTMAVATAGELVYNAYAYFGQPTVWPRGFPLQAVRTSSPLSATHHVASPLIQQMLVDNDPDVDAIFRLTRALPITFQHDVPPICLPPGTFCPCNSQSTLFHSQAFWGLVIPVTPSFRACDIWRGYWVQRLLWDIGGNLCFAPPIAYQERNVHDFFADYQKEQDVYLQAYRLAAFLSSWTSTSPDLVVRIKELTHDMIQAKFYAEPEQKFLEAWLDDLSKVGYHVPEVRS